MRGRMYRYIFSWTRHWLKASGQLHTHGRCTPGGRSRDIPWIGGRVGPGTGLDEVKKRKFLPLTWLELQPLGRPARLFQLWRIWHLDHCRLNVHSDWSSWQFNVVNPRRDRDSYLHTAVFFYHICISPNTVWLEGLKQRCHVTYFLPNNRDLYTLSIFKECILLCYRNIYIVFNIDVANLPNNSLTILSC
jgi:hypothetical protein